MKIIIVGDGNVGDTLIQYISGEGHSVTVIDINPALIDRVVNQYDVLGITGNGASHEILAEAGVEGADLFIAVANSDELNMVCCSLAKNMGAMHTIARVRAPEYSHEQDILREHLGVDMMVNPEYDTAHEIARLIRFPAALKLDAFANGRVDMAEINVSEKNLLAGVPLSSLYSRFGVQVLVCVVRRGNKVFIPSGDFVIQAGDNVSLTASHHDLSVFFAKIGILGKPIRKVMLIGGGTISYYLAKELAELKIQTCIVEKKEARATELATLLPKTQIVLGDCADSELLEEEGLAEMDACIALTDNDEKNVISSIFAKSLKVEKIITKINQLTLGRMLPQIGVDCMISPRQISAAAVLRYIRGLENRVKIEEAREKLLEMSESEPIEDLSSLESTDRLRALYKLCDGRVEALEFDVDPTFRCIGMPLMSPRFRLKANTLIASIVRNGEVIYPHGTTTLEVGDSVIVVTTQQQLCALNDILAGE